MGGLCGMPQIPCPARDPPAGLVCVAREPMKYERPEDAPPLLVS